MLRTLLRDESNRFRVVEDLTAISDIVQNRSRMLWLDLESPTLQELRMVQEEFTLHPLAIEDAAGSHPRPKVDQYENFYLVVFYSVGVLEVSEQALARAGMRSHYLGPGSTGEDVSDSQLGAANTRIVLREITMFLGENYLITVHSTPVPEIEEAAERWRRNIELIPGKGKPDNGAESSEIPGTRPLTQAERSTKRGLVLEEPVRLEPIPTWPADGTSQAADHPMGPQPENEHGSHVGILLYSLLDSVVDNYFPVIDTIVDRVEDLEEQIFRNYSQEAIESVFTLKKDLLALRKVLAPERDVMNILIRRDLPIFEEHTMVYLQDLYDHVVRITDSIDTYRDLLSSALDSFLSMQSNRLNITVQTLTSVSIMLMSVAAVTGWYGMNFQNMPELSSWFGYPGVFAFVAIIVIAEFIFFRRKKWL